MWTEGVPWVLTHCHISPLSPYEKTTTAGYWSKDTLAPEGATLLLQAGDTEQLSSGWMTMGAPPEEMLNGWLIWSVNGDYPLVN